MRVLFFHIGSLPAKKQMTLKQMSIAAQALLEPIRERTRNSPNALARCFYYQAEWKACVYDRNLEKKSVSYLRKCLEIVRKNRECFRPDWEAVVELQIANELASVGEKAKESLGIFRKHYHGQTPETSGGAIFLSRYMNIAFLAGDLTTAKNILQQFENNSAIKVMPTIYMMGLLMRIKLDLAEGNFEDAALSIQRAKAANKESYFLANEVPIRGLETILAFKQGNTVLVEQMVQRNIRWLRSRRISLASSSWIYLYLLIENILSARITGEAIRPILIKHFQQDFQSEYPDYYLLLESEL
jgi:hypothetical protein